MRRPTALGRARQSAAPARECRCRIRRHHRAHADRRGQDQRRRHRLDADLDGAGADDVRTRSRAVLRRHGAQEKRAGDADAELRVHVRGHDAVVAHRLFMGVHPRQRLHRGLDPRAVQRHDLRPRRSRRQADGVAPGADHPRDRVRHVSDDICDHHAGTDRGRLRGPHEILRHAGVLVGLVAAGVRARSRTWCGNRPAG